MASPLFSTQRSCRPLKNAQRVNITGFDKVTFQGTVMRITILMLSLSILSSNAMAEWIDVGGNDYSTVFADPATIRKAGNYEEMLNLYDTDIAEVVGKISFKSSMSLEEYDCKEKQSRTLAFYWYSGNMGEGKLLYSNTVADNWGPDVPKSINETLWKIACGKT